MVSKEMNSSGSTKKKWTGLGSYLPKAPSYLLQKKSKDHAASSSESMLAHDHDKHSDGEEPVSDDGGDMLHALPERKSHDGVVHAVPSASPSTTRRRGMTLEITSLYKKMRQSHSASERDPPSASTLVTRRSLTDKEKAGGNVPSPQSDPALKAQRGSCVATKFGTGTVLDIRLDDGFYVVQLVPKSIAYLREDAIIREIKSVVGERVKTRWGLATVEAYYVEDDMYSIALDWRWDDDHVWRMKATTKKFEKIQSRSIMQNTKNMIFEGYSTFRESTSTGYANVVSKLNTTKINAPAFPKRNGDIQETRDLGKVSTAYGVSTVLEVRSDRFFVVKTPCGATAYLHADSVRVLQRRTHFAPGDRVKTPYGLGEVVMYRDEDETYEVKLELGSIGDSVAAPTLYMSDVYAETMMFHAPPESHMANRRLSSIFNMTRNSVYSASASVKASAAGGFTTLSTVKAKVSTMATMKIAPKPKFEKGERVLTKGFGSGFVTEVRLPEKIYEVYLRRLKFTGYFHESTLSAFPYERVTHFVVDGKTVPAPELPKNTSDMKRRAVISAAIKSAREGKGLFMEGNLPNKTTNSTQPAEQEIATENVAVPPPVPVSGVASS